MSWLSQGLKSVGKGIQKVANTKVAGVSLGSVLGPGGQLVRGGNIKQNFIDDFTAGAKNLPKVVPAVAALKAVGAPGFANTISGGPPGSNNEFGDFSGDEGGYSTADGDVANQPWYKDLLHFVGSHGGDIAKLGLTAAAGYEGVKNSQQAAALQKDALAKVNAPLHTPDLNYIFADPSNTFKKGRLPVVGSK